MAYIFFIYHHLCSLAHRNWVVQHIKSNNNNNNKTQTKKSEKKDVEIWIGVTPISPTNQNQQKKNSFHENPSTKTNSSVCVWAALLASILYVFPPSTSWSIVRADAKFDSNWTAVRRAFGTIFIISQSAVISSVLHGFVWYGDFGCWLAPFVRIYIYRMQWCGSISRYAPFTNWIAARISEIYKKQNREATQRQSQMVRHQSPSSPWMAIALYSNIIYTLQHI